MVKIDIDLCNQIDNKWVIDSVLGAVSEELRDFHVTVKIRGKDKNIIKRKFIKEPATEDGTIKKNRKIVNTVYSYLIFKLVILIEGRLRGFELRICRDHKPTMEVDNIIQTIFRYMNHNAPRYFFRSGDGRSAAHKKTLKVFRGRRRPTLILSSKELKELEILIQQINKNA